MVNPNRFYTYAYLRKDRTPYYIGKGSGRRIYDKKGRPCNKPKDKSRIIFLKKNLTEEEAFKHEKYMISVFGRKDLGTGILRNRTDGGEGCSGAIITEENRRNRSERIKGEKHYLYGGSLPEETKMKISKSNTGRTHTEETKRKQSELSKGRTHTEETKIKISKSNTGRTHTEETKIKISESQRGENHYLYGKSLPEETKRKMREANKNKKWWNDGCGNTKFAEECPGEGWVPGRGKIKKG